MDKFCFGCGVKLQTKDKDLVGYVTENALDKDEVLCKRCFHIRNYNDSLNISLNSQDFYDVLDKVSENDSLVVLIVDVFDFNGSMINGLNRFVQNDIILLGNKFDLLPRSVKKGKVINWMKKSAKESGLLVKDATVVSAKSGFNLDSALDMIEDYRDGRDVYFVGCTNVGKSSLINKILVEYTDIETDVLTTSKFPGTTLNVVEIPLDEHSSIIDTPGIINEEQIIHFIDSKKYKKIMPKDVIRPIIYQIDKGQSLFFEDVGIVDIITDKKMSAVCYFSSQVNIHRTKYSNKKVFISKNKQKYLKDINIDKQFIKTSLNLKENEDVVISGLGWIKVTDDCIVNVYTFKGVGILKRNSLV